MTSPNHKWLYPKQVPSASKQEFSSYSPVLQSVLFQRGIKTKDEAETYLSRDKNLQHNPALLSNIDTAGNLVKSAVENQKSICIYGDYDADGVTGTALLVSIFRQLVPRLSYYIPHRIKSGYGLNQASIDRIISTGAELIITVDCGITALEPIAYAKSRGLTVIVTDHHQPGLDLPTADAILNPNNPGDHYPNKNLAGVGVAYKFIQYLSDFFPDLKPEIFLPLVAIGTVSDVVPLIGENRYLTAAGLKQINNPHTIPQGLFSLLGAAGLQPGSLSSEDIAYQIGPRINAAGRIADAAAALELLLLESKSEAGSAGELALKLNSLNSQRKIETDKILQHQKITDISNKALSPDFIFVADKDFHPGVIGIAAGKLSSVHSCPVVIGSISDSLVTASCRSVAGFNITNALRQLSNLLDRFGGHSAAAGFTAPLANISLLSKELHDLVSSDPDLKDLSPSLQIEAEIDLPELTDSLLAELDKLEPTGHQNPRPILMVRDVKASKIRLVGSNQNHLRFLASNDNASLNAIGFGLGDLKPLLSEPVDLLCHLEENIYRNRRSLQLRVLDLRPAQSRG